MNAKDIRDIAAYLYARCTFEVLWERWVSFDDHNVYSLLWEILGKDNPPQVRNVKVYLRQIGDALTDDEMLELAKLNYSFVKLVDVYTEKYKRCVSWNDGGHSLIEMCLYDANELIVEVEHQRQDPIPYVAYLQSIGVYVPGSIDPQYVELLP